MEGSNPVQGERLQSRHPFGPAACKLLSELSKLSIRAAQWIDFQWDAKYSRGQADLHFFVAMPSTRPLGMSLPRPAWTQINRLRTDVGRYQLFKQLGLRQSVNAMH